MPDGRRQEEEERAFAGAPAAALDASAAAPADLLAAEQPIPVSTTLSYFLNFQSAAWEREFEIYWHGQLQRFDVSCTVLTALLAAWHAARMPSWRSAEAAIAFFQLTARLLTVGIPVALARRWGRSGGSGGGDGGGGGGGAQRAGRAASATAAAAYGRLRRPAVALLRLTRPAVYLLTPALMPGVSCELLRTSAVDATAGLAASALLNPTLLKDHVLLLAASLAAQMVAYFHRDGVCTALQQRWYAAVVPSATFSSLSASTASAVAVQAVSEGLHQCTSAAASGSSSSSRCGGRSSGASECVMLASRLTAYAAALDHVAAALGLVGLQHAHANSAADMCKCLAAATTTTTTSSSTSTSSTSTSSAHDAVAAAAATTAAPNAGIATACLEASRLLAPLPVSAGVGTTPCDAGIVSTCLAAAAAGAAGSACRAVLTVGMVVAALLPIIFLYPFEAWSRSTFAAERWSLRVRASAADAGPGDGGVSNFSNAASMAMNMLAAGCCVWLACSVFF